MKKRKSNREYSTGHIRSVIGSGKGDALGQTVLFTDRNGYKSTVEKVSAHLNKMRGVSPMISVIFRSQPLIHVHVLQVLVPESRYPLLSYST
jgi:hypothetical protein